MYRAAAVRRRKLGSYTKVWLVGLSFGARATEIIPPRMSQTLSVLLKSSEWFKVTVRESMRSDNGFPDHLASCSGVTELLLIKCCGT